MNQLPVRMLLPQSEGLAEPPLDLQPSATSITRAQLESPR